MQDWFDNMPEEERKAFLRRILGRPSRQLEGQEYVHVQTMLSLVEPTRESNNQHTITYEYTVGEVEYHVTYFPASEHPIIEVMEDE